VNQTLPRPKSEEKPAVPNDKQQRAAKAREAVTALRELFVNGVLYKNPVLIGAIGLCPVVAAGTSLKNGAALSLLLTLLLLPTCLLFSLVGDKVPMWLRPPVILVLSAALYVPAGMFTQHVMPGTLSALGIYAPLMTANAIIASRAKNFSARHIYYAAIVDGAGCALGFSLVICLSSALREALCEGSLWGISLGIGGGIPGMRYVFAGFLVLGFLSAAARAAVRRRDKRRGDG
jgi:Na+-translocating ferredoxin:NAD+ oxidoreductase RnfE subunit